MTSVGAASRPDDEVAPNAATIWSTKHFFKLSDIRLSPVLQSLLVIAVVFRTGCLRYALTSCQVYPGQHAAHRTACHLNGGHRQRKQPRGSLDQRTLLSRQTRGSSLGKSKYTAIRARKLKRVTGEIADLRMIECDHGAPAFQQPSVNPGTPGMVMNQVETDQNKLGRDTHHDVGVIDRVACVVGCVEAHWFKIEMRKETLQCDRIGAA